MPGLDSARAPGRIRILVFAAAALALVLLWGCWLVYGAGIGTQICESSAGTELNPFVSQWCNGNSWQGWLGSCLAIATAGFAVGVCLALAYVHPAWLIAGTLVSAVAVWAGFALPQEVAGASGPVRQSIPSVPPPQPSQQTPATPVQPGPSPLARAAPLVLPRARVRGLAHDIIPAPLFSCPRNHEPIESSHGPGPATNFDSVLVERGAQGLCASFTSAEIGTFALQQEETEVVSLTFTARDSVRSTSTANQRSFSVEVWAANQGRTYSLILRPSTGEAQSVTVGNLGLARGRLSILIDQPRLPAWVLNGHSSWSARLT
jgi:hypothetical protein